MMKARILKPLFGWFCSLAILLPAADGMMAGGSGIVPSGTSRFDDGFRTWTSAGGNFTIKARLYGVDGNRVQLEKQSDESIITVELDKLSLPDRNFVRSFLDSGETKLENPFASKPSFSDPTPKPTASDKKTESKTESSKSRKQQIKDLEDELQRATRTNNVRAIMRIQMELIDLRMGEAESEFGLDFGDGWEPSETPAQNGLGNQPEPQSLGQKRIITERPKNSQQNRRKLAKRTNPPGTSDRNPRDANTNSNPSDNQDDIITASNLATRSPMSGGVDSGVIKNTTFGFSFQVPSDYTLENSRPGENELLYTLIRSPSLGKAGTAIIILDLGAPIQANEKLPLYEFPRTSTQTISKTGRVHWHGNDLEIYQIVDNQPSGKLVSFVSRIPLEGNGIQLEVGGAESDRIQIRETFGRFVSQLRPLQSQVANTTSKAPVSDSQSTAILSMDERLYRGLTGLLKLSFWGTVIGVVFWRIRAASKKRRK